MSDIEEPDSSLESIRERLRALGGDADLPRVPHDAESTVEEAVVEEVVIEETLAQEPVVDEPAVVPAPVDEVPTSVEPVAEETVGGGPADDIEEPPVEWSSPDSVEIVREEVMVVDDTDSSSGLGLAKPEQPHADAPPSVGSGDDESREQAVLESPVKPDKTAVYLFRIIVLLMFVAGLIAIALALI